MTKPMDYAVYTPPGWERSEKLPLILFLHGGNDNHMSFEKFQTHQYFDERINAGAMQRAIVLSPNGKKGFWENWHDGSHNYRDWVIDNVMPTVQTEYNTLPCPQSCHLMGTSMGGFGALRFAYFTEDRFSSVSVISAPIFNREPNQAMKTSWLIRMIFPLKRIFGPDFETRNPEQMFHHVWVNDPKLQKIRLQLVWGDNDLPQVIQSNRAFHAFLTKNRIPHDTLVYSGNHKWKAWLPNFNYIVKFLLEPPEAE